MSGDLFFLVISGEVSKTDDIGGWKGIEKNTGFRLGVITNMNN